MQEGAGRRGYVRAAEADQGGTHEGGGFGRALADGPGDAANALGGGEGGQFHAVRGDGFGVGADQQVHAVIEQVGGNVSATSDAAHGVQHGAQRFQQAFQRGVQHGAAVDGHQVQGVGGVQADHHAFGCALGGEFHAAAGAWRGAMQLAQGGGFVAGAHQGAAHHVLLPGGVGRVGPMLQGAATTGAEMRAWRVHAVGAGREDGFEPGAALSGQGGAHGFAGEGERHEDSFTLGGHGSPVSAGGHVGYCEFGFARLGRPYGRPAFFKPLHPAPESGPLNARPDTPGALRARCAWAEA